MSQSEINLDLSYHSDGQQEIFKCEARYVVAPCGRRYGKTEGAFRRLVGFAVRPQDTLGLKKSRQLWVDTTQGNIEKYFQVYLEPMLKPLQGKFKWNKQQKVLAFWNGSLVHFGSAQEPQNLEGFAYDVVWLNEAGHILGGPAGQALWASTILPMTVEGRGGRGAQVFFLGTPKDRKYGPGLFRQLARRGDDSKDGMVRTFHRSTYDNPHMTEAVVREMVESGELKPEEIRQEIYGEFEDATGRNMVVPYLLSQEALNRDVPEPDAYWPIWGLDVARGGADDTALARRQGRKLLEPVKCRHSLMDGNEVADWVAAEYNRIENDDRPKAIFVDMIGFGSAALDVGRRIGLPMIGVNVASRAVRDDIYFRLRDEMWFKGAKWCEIGNLAGDKELAKELAMVAYSYMPGNQQKKVESKDELRRLGHSSPNRADAFLLTLNAGNDLRQTAKQMSRQRRSWSSGETTWMSV